MASVSISHIASQLIDTARERHSLTVDDCVRLLGRRSIMLVILLFSLINSIPLPGIPGVSTITGLPIMLLGLQMLIGFDNIWLPRRITSHRMKVNAFTRHMEKLLPRLRKLEQKMRPRLSALFEMPFSNLIGAVIAVMGFLLALPIPFTNFFFGVSLSILAIGYLAQDGLMALLGLFCCLAAMTAFVLLIDGGLEMLFW